MDDISRTMFQLEEQGLVVRVGEDEWSLTEKGKEHARKLAEDLNLSQEQSTP